MKIIITGASRGIGFETALELTGRRGHEVLALSRNAERLQLLQDEARRMGAGARLWTLPFDLNLPDFAGLEQAVDRLGGADVLINNAGYLVRRPFADLEPADWQRSFQVNVLGPAALIRFFLPYLRRAERAHVVNISSMGGFQGSVKFPGLSAYSASKAALANLTECLAEEWKEENIATNCLALGAVATEMLEEAFPGYEAPLTSAEMATFLADFAIGGHRFFNGKVLPVSVSTP